MAKTTTPTQVLEAPVNIQSLIFTFCGVQVMIDRDLAMLYQAENKRLNEQVKRNSARFPEVFRFQLTDMEKNELVANCDRFRSLKRNQQYLSIVRECIVSAHDRFREYFMFQLTNSEADLVVSQNATPSRKLLGRSKMTGRSQTLYTQMAKRRISEPLHAPLSVCRKPVA